MGSNLRKPTQNNTPTQGPVSLPAFLPSRLTPPQYMGRPSFSTPIQQPAPPVKQIPNKSVGQGPWLPNPPAQQAPALPNAATNQAKKGASMRSRGGGK